MFSILKAYGIPPHILGAIKATYNSLRAKVVSPDGDTDCFNISAGVMQGESRYIRVFINLPVSVDCLATVKLFVFTSMCLKGLDFTGSICSREG